MNDEVFNSVKFSLQSALHASEAKEFLGAAMDTKLDPEVVSTKDALVNALKIDAINNFVASTFPLMMLKDDDVENLILAPELKTLVGQNVEAFLSITDLNKEEFNKHAEMMYTTLSKTINRYARANPELIIQAEMPEKIPETLYCGMTLSYDDAMDFDFSADLIPPRSAFINPDGIKCMQNGNEAGIYLSESEVMAGSKNRGKDLSIALNRYLLLGPKEETIRVQPLEVKMMIQSAGLPLHKPRWAKEVEEQNKTSPGDEYITNLPINGSRILGVAAHIDGDFLFGPKDFDAKSKEDLQTQVREELRHRAQKLYAMTRDLETVPPASLKNISDMKKFKACLSLMYGDDDCINKNRNELPYRTKADVLAILLNDAYKRVGFSVGEVEKAISIIDQIPNNDPNPVMKLKEIFASGIQNHKESEEERKDM